MWTPGLDAIRLRTERAEHLLAAAGTAHFVAQGYAGWNPRISSRPRPYRSRPVALLS